MTDMSYVRTHVRTYCRLTKATNDQWYRGGESRQSSGLLPALIAGIHLYVPNSDNASPVFKTRPHELECLGQGSGGHQ